jgi:mannosyltransferase OCH1-like enzyme
MERALGLRSKNDRATALQAFEHVAAIDPGRGLIEVAHEQVALGKPEAARHTYRQVLAMLPMNYPAMLGLTELELLAANYEACVAVCDELISAYPMRVAPYRQKARALLYLDRADCAISLMQELEKVNGPTAEADAALLEILRTCGRWHEAQAVLALPRVAAASAFPLWFETVLTRLTFFDLSGAKASLERPPAVRPFEHSRVTYAQGVLADLEWRVDDAIRGFQGALTLHAQDSGAHHHLARLHLLKADADGAMHHLRCMNQLNLSALSMRGESVNVSQNLIGQLVNELRLDRELHVRLAEASRLEPHLRIDAMAELVRFAPALTPPAMGYLLALRQSGHFDVEASGDMPSDASALRIPRKLMQFWDQRTPPQDITDLLRTWVEAHPGYSYSRFDNLTAREYLADHYPREVSKAFGCARHPAQASDLFRLAHLLREGGFYVDADDRCVGDLAKLITTGTVLVGYQEQYATLGNNFLGCIAGEPVIERALALAVETLLRGDSETIWLATGPGLLTRAFAEVLLKQASGWQEWLRQRRILDRNELSTVSWPHSISQYKNTRRSWLRSGFKSRVQPT